MSEQVQSANCTSQNLQRFPLRIRANLGKGRRLSQAWTFGGAHRALRACLLLVFLSVFLGGCAYEGFTDAQHPFAIDVPAGYHATGPDTIVANPPPPKTPEEIAADQDFIDLSLAATGAVPPAIAAATRDRINKKNGNLTGNDSDPLVDPRGGLASPSFEAGLTFTKQLLGPGTLPWNATLFARTGIVLALDPDSSISYSGVLSTASGTATSRQPWTVPLLLGVSVPVSSFGIPVKHLDLEVFGGAQIKHKELSFGLVETGFGPPAAVSASGAWTNIDPAIGVGTKYAFGSLYGHQVSFTSALIFDWGRKDSVTAQSPTFPTVTYTETAPYGLNIAARLGLDIALDQEAAPPPVQQVQKKKRSSQ